MLFVQHKSCISLAEIYRLNGLLSPLFNIIPILFEFLFFCFLFDLILYVPSAILQLNRDDSSWVEPVLSWDKCVLLKDHNAVTPVRLEPVFLF